MISRQKNFFVNGNIAFNDRQKSIFDILDKLTPENSNQRYTEDRFKNSESKTVVDNNKRELKQFRGQESIFKRPEMPKKRSIKMSIPDFVKNPQKWKKYKMSSDIMTDKSNTAAAMTFLKEMKDRKEEPMEVDSLNKLPIIFNKHIKTEVENLASVEPQVSSSFVNGKRIMPEYVVGQKVKKSVTFKKTVQTEIPESVLKLGHLFDEDEELS